MIPLSLLLAAIPQAPVQIAQHVEVTDQGADVVREYRDASGQIVAKSSNSQGLVTGPRWSENDGGLAWICEDIAVGDNGASVMASKGLNNEAVTLYSTGSATPIFHYDMLTSEDPQVAVAARANFSFAMEIFDTDPSSNYDFEATVHAFDNCDTSGTPLFSYTFPKTLNYFGGGVAVNDAGNVFLAWKADPNTQYLLVEAFDQAGNSISSGQLQTIGSSTYFHARQARLSEAGDRAYFFVGTDAIIYDVNSGTEIYRHAIGASFDSHALSGDGETFAYGNFGFFNVYTESSPGVWTLAASQSFAGGTYVARLDLNSDGSRLGYQIQQYSPAYDHIEIGMYDVAGATNMFTASYDAPGTAFQLVCSGVSMDDNGDYVAGCSWGDDLGVTPEGFVYDDAGNVTCELGGSGSAFDCSLDADGDVFAMGTKAVHANTFGNGGDIFVADAYDQNLHILGLPQLGGTVTIEAPDTGTTLQLGVCSSLGNSMSSLGQTELDLSTLITTFVFPIPVGGLSQPVTVPANPALACWEVHVQGGILGGSPTLTNKVSLRLIP
ncbi:MAG: hypothetical protein DWQ01_02395 [Planctomycetota bacterium]|nr:MAG: hypothetical protein DWQ01_02395 [Planctomycetota bacterium]